MSQEIKKGQLTKIGVFYDGNYFLHISNYYNYIHARRTRLSIAGIHQFIEEQVGSEEDSDPRCCKIVDARYFRGRISAQEASQKGNLLYYDRVFDDILMSEGVLTHYLPIRNFYGKREEKGVETYLSLEAYEVALFKKLDVVVLIASDGDYVPIVKKLNALGVRVLLLSWEFEFVNDEGQRVVTRTSQDLASEVNYSVAMHSIVEGKFRREVNANQLFVQPNPNRFVAPPNGTPAVPGAVGDKPAIVSGETAQGEIYSLKNGYGFIKYPPSNLFFHYTSVMEGEFSELQEGDHVEFTLDTNDEGQPIAKNVRLVPQEDSSYL